MEEVNPVLMELELERMEDCPEELRPEVGVTDDLVVLAVYCTELDDVFEEPVVGLELLLNFVWEELIWLLDNLPLDEDLADADERVLLVLPDDELAGRY